MKKFEQLQKGNIDEIEKVYLDKWEEMDILNKTIETR